MRPSRRDIIIATRISRLARAQAEAVGQYLQRLNPRVKVDYVPIETTGDKVRHHPLAQFGGKGLFTSAVESAVLRGEADIAVHSYKDLPTELTPGLVVAATPRRRDPRDVLIAPNTARIADLPHGARVGTCSHRRGAQLLRIRPDLIIEPLRGNVDTRRNKVLVEHQFDATLLAMAGLERLGIDAASLHPIDPAEVLPACAQGALAIQCRADDHVTMRRLMPLNDAVAAAAVNAERLIAHALGADCHSPIAALAETVGTDRWRIRVRVLSPDGASCAEAEGQCSTRRLRQTCDALVQELRQKGAERILAEAAAAAAKR